MRQYCYPIIIMLICLASKTDAQSLLYQADTSIKVYAYGQQQNMAWCGGFNNPKFAMADLNNDGKQDLVVFEPGFGVRTFINSGVAGNPYYTYAPEYALNFPPIFDYLILADYNCDNVPDLFQQGTTGFSVYRGYYNANNQLCFTFYKDLYYDNDAYTNGKANAFNNPGDIPAIVDVDGDGDLDFLSYDVVGGNINWYKNMRVEQGLPCDSIVIDLVDRCWGKVYQGVWRAHQLQYDCDESGLTFRLDSAAQKKTHQGNTPCLFDYDGDGDYDYLDGSISYNEMTFLLNGKAQYGGPDSMIYQDTMWQSNGTQIELPLWPAAFNIDIDQDGKKDLLIAPNAENAAENYKCVWFYKNETTPGNPSWVFESDTFLIDKTIDLGTAAYPVLYDYNKDGKPDLFVGSDGYFQSDGTLRSRISYYENTSTPGNPSFTLQTQDFMGLSTYSYMGAAPAFGDINNDGKDEMLIGHKDGTVSYFTNVAASGSVQPVWQLSQQELVDSANDMIMAGGGHAAPVVYDVNKDGKPDLVLGEMYGYLMYYQNNGTAGQLSLQLVNNELGGARVDPLQNLGNYSTPFIGKLDSTGNDYLLMGSNSGNLYRFDGIQSGNVNATYTLLDAQYNYIDTTFLTYSDPGTTYGIYGDLRTAPVVGDIDGDGVYEMLVGEIYGGVKLFKQKPPVKLSVPSVIATYSNTSINVYPNPANDMLHLICNQSLQSGTLQVSIINMEGQELLHTTLQGSQSNTAIPVSSLAPGLYVCVVQAGNHKYYNKFTILR